MKKKILALAMVAAMSLGLVKTAGSESGSSCKTYSVKCPSGMNGGEHGGWTGIVCSGEDYFFYMSYYCTEEAVDENIP